MHDQQDPALARGLKAGDVEAWHKLYDNYSKQVWRSVARLMGANSSDVADVVQETFLAAAHSARTYDAEKGSLWLWLCGIARKQVALHYRKGQRYDRIKNACHRLAEVNFQGFRAAENREPLPASAMEHAEIATLVRTVLTELPEDYETLLTAKYLDGFSMDQIAAHSNCTSTAVSSKLARARKAFRQAFENISNPYLETPARDHHESRER